MENRKREVPLPFPNSDKPRLQRVMFLCALEGENGSIFLWSDRLHVVESAPSEVVLLSHQDVTVRDRRNADRRELVGHIPTLQVKSGLCKI